MENYRIPPITYTRREAADALHVSMPTLDALMHRRDNPLPFFKHGPRLYLIPVASIEQWAKEEAERTMGKK